MSGPTCTELSATSSPQERSCSYLLCLQLLFSQLFSFSESIAQTQASSRCFIGENSLLTYMDTLSQNLSTIHQQIMPGNLRRFWISRIKLFCTVFMSNLMPQVNTASPQITYRGPNHAGLWKSPRQAMVSVQDPSNHKTMQLPQNVAAALRSKCQDIEKQHFAFLLVLVAFAQQQSWWPSHNDGWKLITIWVVSLFFILSNDCNSG